MTRTLKKLFESLTNKSPQVYIICGGRRTGTTLLTAILSSDERANPLGQESQILTRMVEACRWGSEHFQDFGRSYFGEYQVYQAFYQDTVNHFTRTVSDRMSPGGVLVLKNPELSRVLCTVDELFPNAQLLATIRDPRDQVAAELEVGSKRVAMGGKDPFFEKRNVIGLANIYNDYNKEILEIYKQKPERLRIVRYEDLVRNPEATIQELKAVTKLKLAFDPSKPWPRVTELAGLKTPSPSSSTLYGGSVDSSSVERYKRDLSEEESTAIEENCREIMDTFGY
ncbi:MAG: sulfotransferase [Saprospiraceae bacterium]|nr:sulfotransferase [Saprospiraceae bacterium]